MGKKKSAPPPTPTAPPPIPEVGQNQAASDAAAQAAEEERLRAKKGRASTLKTGASGLLSNPNTSASASSLLS